MVTIEEIDAIINQIFTDFKIEQKFSSSKELCKDFDKAKQKAQQSQQNYKQSIAQLINCLNNYIQYPTHKKFLFKYKQKASYSIKYGIFHDTFQGYMITIPYIDKREYHCVQILLKKYPHIVKIEPNKYWLIY